MADVQAAGAKASMPRSLEDLRRDFVDHMWKGLLLCALVATPLSLSRASFTGWLPMYYLHACLAIGVIAVNLLLGKLDFRVKGFLLVALFWAIGVPGLFNSGFPAVAVWWLVLSCLVASQVYSAQVAMRLGAAAAVVVLIAAVGFVTGRLALSTDANLALTQPLSWATLVVVTGGFTFLVLRTTGSYNRSVVEMLGEVERDRDSIHLRSMHDQLTGLPLSKLADDRLAMAIHTARRSWRKVAVMFIDIDDFKAINDTHGHEVGDQVLCELAHRMACALRAADTVARVGGDEFMAVVGELPETQHGALVAAKVINALSAPIVVEVAGSANAEVHVSVSIGISIYPDDSSEPHVLRQLADKAMYAAKRAGKNRFALARDGEVVAPTPVAAAAIETPA